jgi:DNA-binding XRE family transcriptional regulator
MSAILTGTQYGKLTVRCKECKQKQFMSSAGRCVKCHTPYEDADDAIQLSAHEEKVIERQEANVQLMRNIVNSTSAVSLLPFVIKFLRIQCSMTQRDLGDAIKSPRTWISKLENGTARPNMSSIARLANCFKISPLGMIMLCEELVQVFS